MIPRSHLITLDQVIIGICKTTNSLIVRVVCNVGLTVRAAIRYCHSLHITKVGKIPHKTLQFPDDGRTQF